ncbi:MAG: manganese efflux pump MntP family protein [Thermoplasmatota archaeon]
MELIFILTVSVVLAIDAFVVSVTCGMSHSKIDWRFCSKASLFFGIAQAIFFAGGFFFGYLIESVISKAGPWIAFGLLLVIGVKLIWESIKGWKKPRECRILSNKLLLMMSVATSIDALAIGITFPLLDMPVIISIVIVGLVTFVMSFMGVLIGDNLKGKFDKIAEIIAGIVLIGLGVKVLLDNLL